MTSDFQIRAQYLKLVGTGFLIFVPVCVSRDFEVGSNYCRSRPPVPYGARLIYFLILDSNSLGAVPNVVLIFGHS